MIDWVRDEDGKPKRMANGKYVLQKDSGACFALAWLDFERIEELLSEAEDREYEVSPCIVDGPYGPTMDMDAVRESQ